MFRTVRASTPAPIISTKRRPFTRPMSSEMVLPPAMTAAGTLDSEGQPQFEGQHVHGAGRHDAQCGFAAARAGAPAPAAAAAHRGVTLAGRATAGHSVGHLVDGSVSPHGHDDVGIGREALSDRHGILGVVRGMELHFQSSLDQFLLYRRGDHACLALYPKRG